MGCRKNGITYDEQSMVPSSSNDSCEVCHCTVRTLCCQLSYMYFIFAYILYTQEGKIMCGNVIESCPQLKCDKSQQVKKAGKCCARCLNGMILRSIVWY